MKTQAVPQENIHAALNEDLPLGGAANYGRE